MHNAFGKKEELKFVMVFYTHKMLNGFPQVFRLKILMVDLFFFNNYL